MSATIQHKGNTLKLSGDLPVIGTIAPDFKVVLSDLKETSLAELGNKNKVLLCMPSLDTSTCALETKTFNTKLGKIENLEALVITKDLPFAMRRFCETEGIANVRPASDFRYNDFSIKYGVELIEGGLKALHARAVFVLDAENKVVYTELVSDLSAEPDYDAALAVINY